MGFKDSKTPKTIPFSFGNPNVLITKGLIHYYKDEKDADLSKLENIKTLCMIEIPTTFTIHNLLYFLRCENNHIESVTVLSDSLPESYMVLLTFENVKYMKSFYKKNNTQDLNGFIVAKCQLIFISKIDIYRKSDESQSLLNFVEFPTCPVCLEKWKNDTILRIICNHTFHSNCLRKWKDLTCPICRYSQLPNTTTKNCCSGCGVIQNLWICLVCGDIGCGRYLDGHASKHYELTKHTYAMNINTDEVWDYSGDNFVHRLIQNKKDGSLIDSLKVNNTSNLYRKMDETTSEIIFRFSRELNMQRKFYICKMNEMKKKADDIILEKNLKLIKSKKSLLDFKVEIDSLKNKKICLQENHQKELNKIHSNVIIGHAANLKKLTEKIAKLESCIADEKEMNQCFHVKLKHYEECVEKSKNDVIEKDKELREVKEMNRDLMFSIDASNKINEIKSNLNDSEKMDLRESKLTVNKQKKRNKPKNR